MRWCGGGWGQCSNGAQAWVGPGSTSPTHKLTNKAGHDSSKARAACQSTRSVCTCLVLHHDDGRVHAIVNQRQHGLGDAAQQCEEYGEQECSLVVLVKQRLVLRHRAALAKQLPLPTDPSSPHAHFCASSSAPILTAMAMGARRMGCSSDTMVRFGAGKRTAESLHHTAGAGREVTHSRSKQLGQRRCPLSQVRCSAGAAKWAIKTNTHKLTRGSRPHRRQRPGQPHLQGAPSNGRAAVCSCSARRKAGRTAAHSSHSTGRQAACSLKA